ncbi:MAG: hypothetical protein LBC27_08250 [Spirochaetaceae bacterium]|nr:hypothetical protein [Spirochaetaceae bacterium]
MPAADVTISATFSQIPVKSNFLAELGVSVPAVITPQLSDELNYTALIPHIAAVAPEESADSSDELSHTETSDGSPDPDMTFALIAVPEDPNAELSITEDGNENTLEDVNELPLQEGKKKYVITVTQDELEGDKTRVYHFTVSYEPDLSLKSITLTSSSNSNWSQPLQIQDTQTVTIPYYETININAQPSDEAADVKLSLKSAGGSLGEDNHLMIGASSLPVTLPLGITVEKGTIDGSKYEKTYLLNIHRGLPTDYVPTEYRATGGAITTIKDEQTGGYYEIHTFIENGTLVFNDGDNNGLNAWVLVVAGGGGGGGGNFPSSGGGAGGMIETVDANGSNYTYSLSEALAYDVTVGSGGAGGKSVKIGSGGGSGDGYSSDGSNGGDSKFGVAGNDAAFVAIGGGGGAKRSDYLNNNPGLTGGSSGGGSSSPGVQTAKYPSGQAVSYGNAGGAITTENNFAAGGGGAGGEGSSGGTSNLDVPTASSYGGPGKKSSITGADVTYSRGGGIAADKTKTGDSSWPVGRNGEANTGNGGAGAWNNRGGTGGSGIVIVRFPAKAPASPE